MSAKHSTAGSSTSQTVFTTCLCASKVYYVCLYFVGIFYLMMYKVQRYSRLLGDVWPWLSPETLEMEGWSPPWHTQNKYALFSHEQSSCTTTFEHFFYLHMCVYSPREVGQRKTLLGDCHPPPPLLSSTSSPSSMGVNCLHVSSWYTSLMTTHRHTNKKLMKDTPQRTNTI